LSFLSFYIIISSINGNILIFTWLSSIITIRSYISFLFWNQITNHTPRKIRLFFSNTLPIEITTCLSRLFRLIHIPLFQSYLPPIKPPLFILLVNNSLLSLIIQSRKETLSIFRHEFLPDQKPSPAIESSLITGILHTLQNIRVNNPSLFIQHPFHWINLD